MPDDPFHLRDKTDAELYTWTAQWDPTTPYHLAGQQEIRRRAAQPTVRRTWIAIGISALALVVAVIALFV